MKAFLMSFLCVSASTHAVIRPTVEADLGGQGGFGLLGGNEVPPSLSPATGFELDPGITFRTTLSGVNLFLNFGWGTEVGGVDLSGDLLSVSLWATADETGTGTLRYEIPFTSNTAGALWRCAYHDFD